MSNLTNRYQPGSFRMNTLANLAMNAAQRSRFSRFLRNRRTPARRGRRAGGRALTAYLQRRATYRSGILGGTNADQRMIYRRKRMPKKKRKNWVRFVKKVNAVDEKDLGSQTVLINDRITQKQGDLSTGSQACLTIGLYGFVNTGSGWLNDMGFIGGLDNASNPTAAAGTSTYAATKYLFQSAVMDCTLRNTSVLRVQQGETVVDQLAPEAAIELDIYTLQCSKELADKSVRFTDISNMLNSFDDPQIGGTGDGYQIQDRGATPFEFGAQMGRFGVRVTKKQKFFIPNGQTITFQTRDPKRRVIMKDRLAENDGFVKPGWTQIYYLIYKLVPGLNQGTTAGNYLAKIDLGLTRKYMFKVEGRSEPRERSGGAAYTAAIAIN